MARPLKLTGKILNEIIEQSKSRDFVTPHSVAKAVGFQRSCHIEHYLKELENIGKIRREKVNFNLTFIYYIPKPQRFFGYLNTKYANIHP